MGDTLDYFFATTRFPTVISSITPISWTTLILVICLIFLLLIFLHTETRGMPGPYGLPFIGYLPFLNPQNLHVELTELSRRYGRVYQLSLGQKRVVVISDRKLIRQALGQEQLCGRPKNGLTAILAQGGESLLALRSPNAEWYANRRLVSRAITLYAESRRRPSEQNVCKGMDLFRGLIRDSMGVPVDPRTVLQPPVEATVGGLCFGRSISLQDSLLKRINADFNAILDHQPRIELLTFIPCFEWFCKKDVTQCLRRVRSMVSSVRSLMKPHKPENYLSNSSGSIQVRNLSQALFMAKHSDGEVPLRTASLLTDSTRDPSRMLEMDLYDSASHTIFENLSWILILFAKHSKVQDKVQRLLDVGIPWERGPRLEDRPFLPYVEACLLESLRFASNLPFAMPHIATETIEDFDGYRIPKGSLIMPNLWSVHHDPAVFPEPFEFKPERFLDSKGGINRQLADELMVFSSGIRRCLGERIAKEHLFLFLTHILMDYRVQLDESSLKGPNPLEPIASFSLAPRDHKLVFLPRNNNYIWQ